MQSKGVPMSEVAGQGPLDLFEAGEAELLSRAGSYREAREHQQTVEGELRDARTKTDGARRVANEHGIALLEQIHDSVTEDTDPSEYLAAILNTYHSGQRIGDDVASRLAPMRDQIRQKSIPIGVVGSTMNRIRLGLSAGDIKVRRRQEQETGFDTFSGVRLELPMSRMNSYSGGGTSSWENRWQYNGDRAEPYDVGVVQWLSNLRLAATTDEVRALNDTPHAPYSQHNTVMHHERDIKDHTGFVPFVAYGETAVSGLLAALYEGREIKSYAKGPNPDDVLAAAISLDIAPEAVTEVDVEALKTRLRGSFAEQITSNVRSSIYGEANHRRHFGGNYVDWLITASPQVMNYAGVERDEIIDAVRNGIERSIDELRVDDEADRPTWIGEEAEYRLLEDEAREKAVGLIAVRYGLTIEPSQLQSETLNRKLAERLETKREEQARHEKFVREHPWVYAEATR
jgi:hypothetical protein